MIFLVTFLVMLLVIVGMSVGVLLGRKPIAGSCGGVGNALGESDYVCELCGDDEEKCESINQDNSDDFKARDLAVDATEQNK